MRVVDVISEDRRAAFEFGKRALKTLATVEHVVAEDQGDVVLADEGFGDEESLRNSGRFGLLAIFDGQPPGFAVAQQLLKPRQIVRRGDETEFVDAALDQRRER